jgi:hypothetical protein
MTLNTVTLTWDLSDFISSGIAAEIILTPTAQLSDAIDHIEIAEVSRQVFFTNGTGQLAGIIACDNSQILPNGWAYTVSVVLSASGQVLIAPFQALINYANGATQDLSSLVPIDSSGTGTTATTLAVAEAFATSAIAAEAALLAPLSGVAVFAYGNLALTASNQSIWEFGVSTSGKLSTLPVMQDQSNAPIVDQAGGLME